MKYEQLKNYIIKPSLEDIGLYSQSAENLLLGTACTESNCGEYVHQVNGPALGIYQMEPATHYDIWSNFLKYKENIVRNILLLCNFNEAPDSQEMVCNLKYATIMARIHYLRVPKVLPSANDLNALGDYYKQYYNTPLGKGSSEKFKEDFLKYSK